MSYETPLPAKAFSYPERGAASAAQDAILHYSVFEWDYATLTSLYTRFLTNEDST